MARKNRVTWLFVILVIILNSTSHASLVDADHQFVRKGDPFPIIFFDFLGGKQQFDLPYPGPEDTIDFQSALQNSEKQQEELNEWEEMVEQEDVARPQYTKADGVAQGGDYDNSEDGDGDFGKRTDTKKTEPTATENRDIANEDSYSRRRAKLIQPFDDTQPRLYKSEADFDDTRYDSKSSFSREAKSQDVDQNPDDQRTPNEELLLTMGGYQRPTEKNGYNEKKKSQKRTGNKPDDGIKNGVQSSTDVRNVAYNPSQYGAQSQIQPNQPQIPEPVPATRYGPVLPTPFGSQENNFAPAGGIQGYPGFNYNDYFSNAQPFDYNAAMNERLNPNELNRFNYPLSRGFFPQPIQSNVLSPENPFNTAGVSQPFNSYQNIPYNPYAGVPNLEAGTTQPFGYPSNPAANVPAFYDRNALPGVNFASQSPTPHGNWNTGNRFFFAPQPNLVPNANFPQDSGSSDSGNGYTKNGENEQKLESTSQEQPGGTLSDQKPTLAQNIHNQYLNYPTHNAGYGTVESLPAINGEPLNKPRGPITHPSSNGQSTEVRYHQPFGNFLPQFPANHQNPFLQLTTPTLANDTTTRGFDSVEYFKNLRANYPFPPTPGNDENIFLRYPDRGNVPVSTFQTPPFPPGSESTTPGSRNGVAPPRLYELLSTPGPAPKPIDENTVPVCAEKSNSTICFEDADYPTNDVLYAVDSEALQLQRFLSPSTFQGSISLNKYDSGDHSPEDDPEICQSSVKHGHPLRAQDVHGKWKVIVNVKGTARVEGFSQDVRLETCRIASQPCSHTEKGLETRCVQKLSVNRLLTWDGPNGLHMSLFKLPVACVCQIVNSSR